MLILGPVQNKQDPEMASRLSKKLPEWLMKKSCLDSVKIVSMVVFIAKKGGCVDWLIFSDKFPCVKMKHLAQVFDLKINGHIVEVWNNEAVEQFAQEQCKKQAEDRIVASSSQILSVPWRTLRESDDGAAKMSIPHGSKVVVPAILSSLSPEPTEYFVVRCIPPLAQWFKSVVSPDSHC